ncbi:MAG TPA: lysylphosphatidylglycerol synthase transmembrane domain-containing protein [Solirubrobacterales bacterium]|nr:lysylphosphatidylglycerol synthase transmembrane domain-containing protein [Solirubrobacterales bacterium]
MTIGRRLWRAITSVPGRIAVTAALLALLAVSIDWSAVGDALSEAAWGWFVLAVALIGVSFVVASERWRMLLTVARVPSGPLATLRAYLAGAFANNLLPTGFGGDALRAWLVAGSNLPLARSLTSVVVDRATALGCGVALAWVGVAIDPDALDSDQLIPLLAVSAAGVAALAATASALRRGGLARRLPERLRPWLGQVAETLRAYLADRRLLALVVALGLAFQAVTVLATWALAETLGLDLSLALLAVVIPLVLIATALPISIGGFGVREGSYVALLAAAGVSTGDATLLSLLSAAAMALASLPGGLVVLLVRSNPDGALDAYKPGGIRHEA